jgi:hypothetical protein
VEIPDPPRTLKQGAKKGLWLGRPFLLLGVLISLLVSLGVFFLMVTYGTGFSYLRSGWSESVRVQSHLSGRDKERLSSGGMVAFVEAQVKVNERIITVKGYGPAVESAKVGDVVTINIPTTDTDASNLVGFWSRPVTPTLILSFALWFYGPAALAMLWSVRRSYQDRRLLLHGLECQGKRVRVIPLPRPVRDHQLTRWEYKSPEQEHRRFWSFDRVDLEDPILLADRRAAAVLDNLLPECTVEDDQLVSQDRWRRILANLTLFLGWSHLLLIALYLMT